VTEQDLESTSEALALNTYLENCAKNNLGGAVELALGTDASYNSFLLNPITIPPGISLIIDGGVTVYASRNPANFQNPTEAQYKCGTVGQNYPVNGGCVSFITLSERSGIYGYGILDGQGNQPIFQTPPPPTPKTWWDLITIDKKDCPAGQSCQEASPQMISAGNTKGGTSSNSDFIFYKFTIRNPQFHTVNLGGSNQTVWGVKIQAPWNVPNTDGFDIHASNVTVYDTTVANGDQEIAFSATPNLATANVTVDQFHGYNKGGITILGNDGAFSNILVQNVDITGDLPQVSGTTVNGVSEGTMKAMDPPLQSYGQALPNATGDLKALQITTNINPSATSKSSALISNIAFQSVCIRDIIKPINVGPVVPFKPTDQYLPVLQNVSFKNIHILSPSDQFPSMSKGIVNGSRGTYQTFLDAYPQPANRSQYINQLTLNNLVFDDTATGSTSLGSISAVGNNITTANNVYPAVINQLESGYVKKPIPVSNGNGTSVTLSANVYASATTVTDPSLAYQCSVNPPPFITGDLFISQGNNTNLQAASISAGDSVTLNAVVQPIMSQATYFVADSYGADPGLLAIGSPALTNPVSFYEGATLVGKASLSANGTLASLVLKSISAGTHTYTAQYAADTYYAALNFGSVTVTAVPPAATTTSLSASATTIDSNTSIALTAKVAQPSGDTTIPTGSVTFLDGTKTLDTVSLDPTGSATYSTAMLSVGNHPITASYMGDINFTTSTSSAVTVTVDSPPPADFSVSLDPGSLTLSKFAPSAATVSVAPANGFNSAVTFACIGLPVGVSCSFSPATVTPSGSAAVSTNVALSVDGTDNAMLQNASFVTLAFSLGGWLLVRARRRCHALRLWLVLFVVTVCSISGCGTNSGTVATATRITITATSGSTSHSTDLMLTYVKVD
jgi:hypothetical protein